MKLKISLSNERLSCHKKFLHYFPKGFIDATYTAWERKYKSDAHFRFQQELNRQEYERLLSKKDYYEIALRAVKIETKTNLLFSFEKMALRDAVKQPEGAKAFAQGLFNYVYGKEELQQRFEDFAEKIRNDARDLQPKDFIDLQSFIWVMGSEEYPD